MTARAVAGLAGLNLALLCVGATLLWGMRGWRSWSEILRLAGVSYVVGVSSLTVVLSTAVVVSIPFGPLMLVASAAAVVGLGLVLGILRGSPRPRGFHLAAPSLVTAIAAGALVVYFEASFRASRLASFTEYDAWWVWTIRAKALYFFGDLGGDELVRVGETWDRTYPPGVPLLQAQAFEAMGGADTVTLHLQQWFLALGFAGAIVGLLWRRARPAILLPSVLFVLVMPGFTERLSWVTADTLLAYLSSIAALQLYLWIEDRSGWRLWSAAVLLAGAALTKREGLIVILILLAAAIVTSWPGRRWAWPRLAALGGLAVGLSASWRISLAFRGVGDGPTEGFLGFLGDPARGAAAFELILLSLIDPTWLGFAVLFALVAGIAFAVGAWKPATFAVTITAQSILAWTYVMWVETTFPISRDPGLTPVTRLAMVTLLTLAPFLPLMLEDALRSTGLPGAVPSKGWRKLARGRQVSGAVTWMIVAVAGLGYPLAVLAGGVAS